MRRALIWLLATVAGCAPQIVNTRVEVVAASTPVRWKVAATCMQTHSLAGIHTRQDLAAQCHDPDAHDFVTLSLSGGGTKAAVFAGETMFYLQALGLLQQASVVSSVSGGSFTGALYALSCDAGDIQCQAVTRPGLRRPVWSHGETMRTLGTGYSALVGEQVVRLVLAGFGASISAGRFAQVIDETYLGRSPGVEDRYTFGDMNPRRPHLFMNATIVSRNRAGVESEPTPGCPGIARSALRRRTPDEFFHFAFSDYYFGLLRSTITDYPVAGGVAASAAFPVLIDSASLRDYCQDKENGIRLMDGGVNDNQGLMEIYMILSELALHQARSDLSVVDPAALERLHAGDRAWFIVVNSSVTETTGSSPSVGDATERSIPALLTGVVDKVERATDIYSAIGYELRKQLYEAEGDRMPGYRDTPEVWPVDISLTSLDQYANGGTEAELRRKSHIGQEPTDIDTVRIENRIRRQGQAYDEIMGSPANRAALKLSNLHPQCYFDMRERLDALISLSPDNQACLREAARWSTALKAQELCDGLEGMGPPKGLDCSHRLVRLRDPAVLDGALTGTCHPILPSAAKPDDDPRVTCRVLDAPDANLLAAR